MKSRLYFFKSLLLIFALISCSASVADDLIITKSDQKIRARITVIKDGKVTMVGEDGKEQTGSISNIKEIQFDVLPLPMKPADDEITPKKLDLEPEKYKGMELVFLKCEFDQDVDRDGNNFSTFITFSDGTLETVLIDPELVKVITEDLEGEFYWKNCGIRIKVPADSPKNFRIIALDVYDVSGSLSTVYKLDENGKGVRITAKEKSKKN